MANRPNRVRLHTGAAPHARYSRRSPIFDQIDPNAPEFHHVVSALMQIQAFGYDIDDPDVIRRAIEKGTGDYLRILDYRDRLAAKAGRSIVPVTGQVVYYVRIGNRCKIGYTTNMANRMATINPEEILATEPGTVDLEQIRHREFARLRTHGEWFRLEDPLTSHIERLRAAS